MEKEIHVEYKEDYLEVSLKGNIDLSEYIALLKSVGDQKKLPKVLKVLGIDNGVKINFKSSDVILLAKIREQSILMFQEVKHAWVVKDPQNTALAFLTSSATNSPNYTVNIFSTQKAALDWLMS